MKLQSTSSTYEFKDESGYKFTMSTSYDPEWGWSASVIMSSFGRKMEMDAVRDLKRSVEAFIEQLDSDPKI